MIFGKNIDAENMIPWKNEVLKKVDDKIRSLKRKFKPKKVNQVLRRPEVVEFLKNLHKNYVLVPIDKASNNIAIVCKRYYVEVILKEIGEIGTGNSTYEKSDKNVSSIVNFAAFNNRGKCSIAKSKSI